MCQVRVPETAADIGRPGKKKASISLEGGMWAGIWMSLMSAEYFKKLECLRSTDPTINMHLEAP